MDIAVRVSGVNCSGANILLGIEYATDTGLSGGGEATIDLSWTESEIEEAIAEASRDAIRQTGATVAEDAPVVIFGGVSKV